MTDDPIARIFNSIRNDDNSDSINARVYSQHDFNFDPKAHQRARFIRTFVFAALVSIVTAAIILI